MSSRVLRKLQRQREQQQQLEKTREGSPHDEESEEEVVKPKALNAFDMLTEDADTEEARSEAAQSSEIDDLPAEIEQKEAVSTPSTKAQSKGKSRNKKKGKKKVGESKQAATILKGKDTQTLDEIDLALKSLSTKDRDGIYAFTKAKTDDTHEELRRLLAVESRHLNALNEMKRLFGSVVLEGDEAPGVPGRRHGRGQRNLDLGGALAAQNSRVSQGQGLAGLALRRNVFMLGKEEWPKATSGGLGMEVVERRKDGTTEYRFVHNTIYQDVQRQFESCVESMDPQRMIQLLQFNPYHISTLLQVSEIAKQQGDHSVSGDLLERALFSFGRSVHSSFATALSEGKARVDFRRPENRELWPAVWRYIHSLGQRGTWRTAYEWAKLLLSLEPERDPYCVRLILDQLALRGSQMEHFLNLSTCPMYRSAWESCPNIRISSALAEYKLKRVEACRDSLQATVHTYPWIFVRLFQELNIEHIPKSIWGIEACSEREKFECELYISYAKDLWNSPDAISFLVEVAEMAETKDGVRNPLDITLDEARHVLLSGTPALMSLIPRNYTTMSTSSSDPLPPPDSLPSYSTTPPERRTYVPPDILDPPPNIPQRDTTAGPAESQDEEQELQGLQGFFSRIIPWLGQSETSAQPTTEEATQDTLNRAATESGIPQEVIVERGNRLLELLRRVLGQQQQEQRALEAQARDAPRPSRAERREEAERQYRELTRSDGLEILRLPPDSEPNNNHNNGINDDDEDDIAFHSAHSGEGEPPAPYDDDRNQRWLAGLGLIALRDAAAAHGTDERQWSGANPETAAARAHLEEYAKRILMLEAPRSRNFILEYALPQGTSREVKEMVQREVERARGRA